FVSLLENTGMLEQQAQRKAIWIHRPIEITDGDKYEILLPSKIPRITVEIDFPNTAIGSQTYTLPLINGNFKQHIASSRTFGFKSDLEHLRKQGLAQGGSIKNAILVDGHQIINEEGLRTETEFVRHKILDAVGDMALMGVPVIGHLIAYKPGHKLNNNLLRRMMETKDAWSYTTVDEINAMMGTNRDSQIIEEDVKATMMG
ncbi:MAG: UDP-3-O-[3-hydroxymyristoyl] N-acetylglucosamine deacetylase, partial [Thiotrichaceae bacterium]|nr:UDP-3-O-[3-hydroxymyristoyl] N-acetylglucosamine deacetylase [Thiotrichaceae bacterium]